MNDEDVADKEAAEREEIDKDKEREMIDHVDSVRVYSKEEVCCLVTVHHHCGVVLNDHVGGALVELQVGVLHLPEHQGLGGGQDKGHNPGEENHQPGQISIYRNLLVLCFLLTLPFFSAFLTGELPGGWSLPTT